jgi:hypothetical protein
MFALRLRAYSQALESGSNAVLPAFQDAGFVLSLALKLRLQTRGVPVDVGASVRRNLQVGPQDSRQGSMWLGVMVIRKTEDPVQEGPMPVTKYVQHACLTAFFARVLEKSFLETIIPAGTALVNIVSRKLHGVPI